MKITRTSILTNITRTWYLDVTPEELTAYTTGQLPLQSAFPKLEPHEREFIKTGIVESEWEDAFGVPEDN